MELIRYVIASVYVKIAGAMVFIVPLVDKCSLNTR